MLDRLGIALFTLCLVHCLLLPTLLALLPLLSVSSLPEWAHDTEWFHAKLLVPVALVSGPALLRAAFRSRSIAATATVAFAALFGALAAPTDFWEQALTVTGATLLFTAHCLNLRRLARR